MQCCVFCHAVPAGFSTSCLLTEQLPTAINPKKYMPIFIFMVAVLIFVTEQPALLLFADTGLPGYFFRQRHH